jgi:hypothetical protein
MPLPNLTDVSPDPIDVDATEIPAKPALAAAVAQVQVATPTDIGVTTAPHISVQASEMKPTEAGFKLAKIVLGITAASIVLFLIYLFAMDWIVGSDVREAYRKTLTPNRIAAELLTATGFEQFSNDLGDALKDPTGRWTPESLQNAQDILKQVAALPSIATDQIAQLKSCVPPPPASDKDRDRKLEACQLIVGEIRQAAIAAATAAADAKVAGDSTFRIGEQRQSLHAFWVQAAQLVLLNLLLPLLTALFGYIFGRQQEQTS